MKTSRKLSHIVGAVATAALLSLSPNVVAANPHNSPPPPDLEKTEVSVRSKIDALAKMQDPNSQEAKNLIRDIKLDVEFLKKLIQRTMEELKRSGAGPTDPNVQRCKLYFDIATDIQADFVDLAATGSKEAMKKKVAKLRDKTNALIVKGNEIWPGMAVSPIG